MIDPPTDQPLAALRVQLRGSWSVAEFDACLRHIDDSYARLASVMLLGELLKREEVYNELARQHEKSGDYTWTHLYHGWYYLNDDRLPQVQTVPLIRILEALQPFVIHLHLDAVRLESPGWLQIVGNLNPLKVLADFVTKWRAENTKRLAIERNAEVDRERIRAEGATARERIRTEFAVNVIRSPPKLIGGPLQRAFPRSLIMRFASQATRWKLSLETSASSTLESSIPARACSINAESRGSEDSGMSKWWGQPMVSRARARQKSSGAAGI